MENNCAVLPMTLEEDLNTSSHVTDSEIYRTKDKNEENECAVSKECLKKEHRIFWLSFILGWISQALSSSVRQSLLNSITSLLPENKLGMISLIISSAFLFLTTTFFLAFITKLIGVKRTILFSMITILLFDIAFFYPSLSVFIPASILVGIGLSIAQCNFFVFGNSFGIWYQKVTEGNLNNILFFISGLMCSSSGVGYLLGNLLYYEVLDTGSINMKEENDSVLAVCGAAYCNENLGNLTVKKSISVWRQRMLIEIFAGFMLVSFLLFLFVTDPAEKLESNSIKLRDFVTILKVTYSPLRDPKGHLLIAMSVFIGMKKQFIMAVFTHDYIACTLGVSKVGLVMFFFGLSEFLAPYILWPVMKIFGKTAILGLFYVLLLGEILSLLYIKPSTDSTLFFYSIAFIFGITHTMAISATLSTYGVLFEKNIESAFSLSRSLGFSGEFLANIMNPFLCCYVKLYILITVGTLSVILQFILEYNISKKQKQNYIPM